METLLYVVLIALIGVVAWLLLVRQPSPQIVYVQQENPVPEIAHELPFYSAWFPIGWEWGNGWEFPWWNDTNYRWSYERLYDGGWPWRRRNNEKVYPSRDRERRRERRERREPRPTSAVLPTINIQLPPAINTVTQRGAAPPPLPAAPPAPEPIPTIHSGPTAPPATPPVTTEPIQVKVPEVIVPGQPDMEPLATVS